MEINQIGQVSGGDDAETIVTLVESLKNLVCWQVRVAYGDEIKFDMGDVVVQLFPKGREVHRGAWVLDLFAASWQLDWGTEQTVSSDDERETFLPHLNALQSLPITSVEFQKDTWKLLVGFANKYRLCASPPEASPDDPDDLVWWKLFMPNNMVLMCGPTNKWEIKLATQRKSTK
jgi:hypothetical protein